nr:hypothetical protein BaRGS_034689 [Batillaria attramentaria]
MVTDLDYLEKKLSCLDLSQLKFKERDFLEGIFKFWRNPSTDLFDAKKCWELRLRQYLGTRYDARFNIFDWDYSMHLIERGGQIINTHQYKNWRNTGQAFEVREGSYDVPNKTLASGIVFKHDGDRHARRGYWGDIIVSPYVPLGIESEEKSLFKKMNDMHIKTAEDVAEYNVLAMFHELAFDERYSLPAQEEKTEPTKDNTPKLQEITEEDEEKEESEAETVKQAGEKGDKSNNSAPTDATQRPLDQEYESLPLEDVKVTFLPLGCVPDLTKRSKFQKAFNVVYFSNSLVHHLTPEFNAVFADRCTVLIESALFMLELKKEQVAKFVEKVTGMAQAAGCKELEKCDAEQDAVVKMYFTR